jgi:TolB protein
MATMTRVIVQLGIRAAVVGTVLIGLMMTAGKAVSSEEMVFVSNRNPRGWDIYIMDVNRGLVSNLTHNDDEELDAMWSPDGERIAFTSDRDGKRQLYLMDDEGGQIRQLTKSDFASQSPVWSPDGRRIVFYRRAQETLQQVYMLNLDTGKSVPLTSGISITPWLPQWSCDGKRLRFGLESSGGVDSMYAFVTDENGNDRHMVLYDPDECYRASWLPGITPDGRHILFTEGYQIYIADMDGEQPRPLTDHRYRNWSPSWRP